MKNISILGATGSIGTQTLDVIRSQKDKFKLVGISANHNYKGIINIIQNSDLHVLLLWMKQHIKLLKITVW